VLLKGHVGNNSLAETAAGFHRGASRIRRQSFLYQHFQMLGGDARAARRNRFRLSFPWIRITCLLGSRLIEDARFCF
jgi:hypothetical protein